MPTPPHFLKTTPADPSADPSVRELVRLLAVEQVGPDAFHGAQPEHWERNRVYGGQVAAQALMAAMSTVEPTHIPHSLHSYFLLPGDYEQPIVYEVERIRDGRSFMTRRVVARQEGRAIYAQTVSFHRDEPGLEHQDAMPPVGDPPHAQSLVELPPTAPLPEEGGGGKEDGTRHESRFWDAIEVRWVNDTPPNSGPEPKAEHGSSSPARSHAWMRIRTGLPEDRAMHAAAFTFASDLTMIRASLTAHDVRDGDIQGASLDHTIWFHQPFAADQWWLYDQSSPVAHGARGLAVAKVFTHDGRLVASTAQESLIRPVARL